MMVPLTSAIWRSSPARILGWWAQRPGNNQHLHPDKSFCPLPDVREGQRESLDASSHSDGVAQVKEVPMKTRRWLVITVLALALSMSAAPVNAAPFASLTNTPPTAPDVKGTVLRQGALANPNTGGGTLACSEVRILPSISGPVFTTGESVLPNFEFSLANPSAGVYTIQAGYSGYLASETTATVPPSRDVGTTTLCGGDVNADRVINILDIGLIIGKFGACNVKVGSSDPTAWRAPPPRAGRACSARARRPVPRPA